MTDLEAKPPVEPTKHFIRGVAFPGVIIGVCAGLGLLIALFYGRTQISELKAAATLGAAAGLFFSLYGVGEVIGAFLGSSTRLMNGVYQSLGYLLVWSVTLFIILPALLFD